MTERRAPRNDLRIPYINEPGETSSQQSSSIPFASAKTINHRPPISLLHNMYNIFPVHLLGSSNRSPQPSSPIRSGRSEVQMPLVMKIIIKIPKTKSLDNSRQTAATAVEQKRIPWSSISSDFYVYNMSLLTIDIPRSIIII